MVLIIVAGAVVLGLVITVAVLVGVVLPRLRNEFDPGPTFAPGELTPEESAVVAVPQPDGTVRVDQVLIFDVVVDRSTALLVGGGLGLLLIVLLVVLPHLLTRDKD